MNIFYLDYDPIKCAKYHCDSHSSKMILEYTQMLCTAIRELDSEVTDDLIYKSCHKNHPCTKWVMSSFDNWLWLRNFVDILNTENKSWRNNEYDHKSAIVARQLTPPINLVSNGFSHPPLCIPDDCVVDDPVESYRNYYRVYKRHLAKWTNRQVPEWWY